MVNDLYTATQQSLIIIIRDFAQLPQHFEVMRYHSLIAERQSLPAQLEISAENDEGIIMAVQHRQWPIYAVQYHPESILSEHGHAQIELFIKTLG